MFGARSLLFVPGHRPERFSKALESGADLVCIDLEDAVPIGRKAEARAAVSEFLDDCIESSHERVIVRIGAVTSAEGRADLRALADMRPPRRVMLAGTESPEDIRTAAAAIDAPVGWIALIESAAGLLNMQAICAGQKLDAVMFGGGDFSAQLGAEFAWEPLLWARSQMAVIAAAYNLPLIDVPYLDVGDEDGLVAETRRIVALGFGAKAAIHPRQIAGLHRGFAPSPQKLEEAQAIVCAFEAAAGGAVVVNGRMVDQPIVDSARRLIARASFPTDNEIRNTVLED